MQGTPALQVYIHLTRFPNALCLAPPLGRAMKIPTPVPPHALAPVPEERAFRFSNGASARSLAELADVLRQVPEGVVWYHREHLVPWVRDVAGDEPLARRLEFYAREGGEPDAYRDLLADLLGARVGELRAAA